MPPKLYHFGSLILVGLIARGAVAERDVGTGGPYVLRAAAQLNNSRDDTPANVLTPDTWRRVDGSVNRALAWLAAQQQPDGSFQTLPNGQPAVTCLCVLAFMAHGHGPSDGVYGARIERAIDYTVKCQKENGLITLIGPDGPEITRDVEALIGKCAVYNHGISSLTLAEVYGSTKSVDSARIEKVINRSLVATLTMQRWPKDKAADVGGWRYLNDYDETDSDLSVTGWQLKFLRSARNAGFNVPEQPIDDAVGFVRRCYSARFGGFQYASNGADSRSRGMAGAGILALGHAGFHNAPEAISSGNWLLAHDFSQYNQYLRFNPRFIHDRYHYGLFMSCQGMYQLGGKYWESFFPPVVETLLANQQSNGSWPPENHEYDAQFGSAYTTALALLTLGAPNQLLPIYQR